MCDLNSERVDVRYSVLSRMYAHMMVLVVSVSNAVLAKLDAHTPQRVICLLICALFSHIYTPQPTSGLEV